MTTTSAALIRYSYHSHASHRRVGQNRLQKQLLFVLIASNLLCGLSTVGLTQTGIITTIAGGGPDNVQATDVPLCGPSTTALDSQGNLYVAIQCQSIIVRIDHATGILTRFAGNASPALPATGDGGLARDGTLVLPIGVAVDRSGNVFIADTYENRIRRVDAITHIITTVVGYGGGCNAQTDSLGDGCLASDAIVGQPWAVNFDHAGNLLIAADNRIRRVDFKSGIITSIAGGGTGCNAQIDNVGDGCDAASAVLLTTRGMVIDPAGNLLISDSDNNLIRRVDAHTNIITTLAGGGTGCPQATDPIGDGCAATMAALRNPMGLAIDSSGNLFIADNGWSLVRRVDAATGIISIFAGGGYGCPGQTNSVGDGCPASQVSLGPYAVVFDAAGNLLISDWGNGRVRHVDMSTSLISTVAGGGTGDNLPALSSTLASAWITFDPAGNLFMSEAGDIRRMDAAAGLISRYAGRGAGCATQVDNLGDGCLATEASLPSPSGIAADHLGNIFVADSGVYRVRRVDAASRRIATAVGTGVAGFTGDNGPATSARLRYPVGVAIDSTGNLFIADDTNHVIRRVDAITQVITTVAGNGSAGFSGDGGPATSASLHFADAVAVDRSGNLFISDELNFRFRKVDAATGIITTLLSGISLPGSIAVDDVGNFFFVDRQQVLRMDAVTGAVTTVAGNGTAGFSGDNGPATSAALYYTSGITLDHQGNIFLSDNSRIRKVNLGLPAMTISATALNFHNVRVGTQSKPQRLTITNTGTALLEFFSIGVSQGFLESNTCASGVDPGSTCQIDVTFSPTLKGLQSGTLEINPNIFNGSASINISGTGVSHSKRRHRREDEKHDEKKEEEHD